jgi:hypothetical protein
MLFYQLSFHGLLLFVSKTRWDYTFDFTNPRITVTIELCYQLEGVAISATLVIFLDKMAISVTLVILFKEVTLLIFFLLPTYFL